MGPHEEIQLPGRYSGTAEPRKGLGGRRVWPGESGVICYKLGLENDEKGGPSKCYLSGCH